MTGVVIEVGHPPFGHENTFAGLYVATASLSKGMDVIVVLRGDGVYTGRRGQIDPLKNINLPATEGQIEDVIELDGRVVADKEALAGRGIDWSELIDGVEVLARNEIHDILLGYGKHAVAF